MNILGKIQHYAECFPERIAFRSGKESLTYGDLWKLSDHLSAWLKRNNPTPHEPIPVYGHKHPWMLVSFLACVKAGCAYCPIDISVPDGRVSSILNMLSSRFLITTETLKAEAKEKQILDFDFLENLFSDFPFANESVPTEKDYVSGEAAYYIIFTSGSTGIPKGVQISADCLNHFLDWSVTLSGCTDEKETVFLNQAPFSFDLSVMDLYTCLACGGTLYCLKKSTQSNYQELVSALQDSRAKIWVSTPSFADMCLSEKKFNETLMPGLGTFLFCGEALGNRTVQKLQERFPKAVIYNTYGPTESTVAVTDVRITPSLNASVNPLPVGTAKPGTILEIRDEHGTVLPDGEPGEIIILGDTVSTGYYQAPELTEKAFFVNPEGLRGYHTGDKGYLSDGMLYYCGRIDLQIKLHGYRIELEDIESNLRKLPSLEHAVVLPNFRGEKISSLTAYVVEKEMPSDEKEEARSLKLQLAEFLPEYMIPKKFVFLTHMPMTSNGKADRKLLGDRK